MGPLELEGQRGRKLPEDRGRRRGVLVALERKGKEGMESGTTSAPVAVFLEEFSSSSKTKA